MSAVLDYLGYCPICDNEARFVAYGTWYRDCLICTSCQSVPRFRAFCHVLKTNFPNYCELEIHESSPTPLVDRIWDKCSRYTASQFYPNIPLGKMHEGFHCQNLEQLTFDDECFDIFVTMDVMEHILDPVRAFKEIARVLRPGGIHIFTVPICWKMINTPRAKRGEDGGVVYLKDPEYHANPIDEKGSLVATDYGCDIGDLIFDASGMTTTIYSIQNKDLGILGEMSEVLVSRKSKM